MKRGFDRTRRVADLIQKALAPLLLEYDEDKNFRLVTITSVTVSRDLEHAKIYVTVLQDDAEKIKQTIQSLNRAAKFFRYELARAVELRVMPELRFVFDESTAHGFHISNLIDSAMKKTDKK